MITAGPSSTGTTRRSRQWPRRRGTEGVLRPRNRTLETRRRLLRVRDKRSLWEVTLSRTYPGIKFFQLDRFPCPGAHNAANAAAALLMVKLAHDPSTKRSTGPSPGRRLATFQPLEHRLEKCGEKAGVVFYNDSKATTSEALSKSIAVFDRSIVLAAARTRRRLQEPPRSGQGAGEELVTFGTAKDLIADALAGATKIVRTPD